MNKNYTLKELADIGAVAANLDYVLGEIACEAFTKAVLDAVGYEFPKDEEREVFERWCESRQPLVNHVLAKEDQFAAWKAGREELKRALEIRDARTEQEHAAELEEPAWIPWNGGDCPLPETVKRWQYRFRYQGQRDCPEFGGDTSPSNFRWTHEGGNDDIIAYRVWE